MFVSTSRSLMLVSAVALAGAFVIASLPASAQTQGRAAVNEQALRQDMQRAIDQRRRELLPEYQRRVRTDGRSSADAWLRNTAERMGREDGERVRRRHDAGAYAAATPGAARVSGERTQAQSDRTSRSAKGRDPECARMVTRQRNVPSVSGGPMQMIMVTECVPAR